MHFNDNDAVGPLIVKLEKLAPLSDAAKAKLKALPFTHMAAAADERLVREGDVATNCCLLLSGYACRHKSAHDGGRQIVSFHHPGDVLDLQHLLLSRADHTVQVLTPATYLRVPAAALKQAAQDHADIAEALWRDTLIDASVFREWVLNVGRRDAKSRIAHMLCEFEVRRKAALGGSAKGVVFPLTQEHIADATGLTPVHVNRTLQVLRESGALGRAGTKVVIGDWAQLQQIAKFSPMYLHAAA